MRRLVAGWVAFWTAAGLLFWHADRHGYALCKAVRWVFGTHTRAGKIKLGVALASGTVGLFLHLVKEGGTE